MTVSTLMSVHKSTHRSGHGAGRGDYRGGSAAEFYAGGETAASGRSVGSWREREGVFPASRHSLKFALYVAAGNWRDWSPLRGGGFARVSVTETESLSAPTPANGVRPVPVLPGSAWPSLATARTPSSYMAPVAACELPAIEIDVRGSKVRIPGSMPPALATAVLRALARR